MTTVRTRYVMQTVKAPPTEGPSDRLVEIEPPKGYKLRDWRAFSGGETDCPWGYALLLWERDLG